MSVYPSLRIAILVTGLSSLGEQAMAQWALPLSGCSVRYDHDNAGNRTSRYWHCWSEHLAQEPVRADTNLVKSDTPEERPLEAIDLHLFPNPAGDHVTITLSGAVDLATYDVYDAQGRSVLTGRLQGDRTDIDLGGAPAGLYNFCLVRGREMLVRPFVVE